MGPLLGPLNPAAFLNPMGPLMSSPKVHGLRGHCTHCLPFLGDPVAPLEKMLQQWQAV